MPTARKSRQPQRSHKRKLRQSAATAITTDMDTPIWGAKAIGLVIGRSERAAYHLLESKALRGAKKIRGVWSAIPRVLRAQWESTGEAKGGEA